MGSVSMSSIGLKKAFNMPKIAAAKNAEIKPLTCMPSSKYELMIIENVKINHLIKMPFISSTSIGNTAGFSVIFHNRMDK